MTTPKLILPADASRDQWLAERRNGIGGSEVAAVLGVSRYAGPTRIYYEKLGVLPHEDNAAMEWGRRLEPVVIDKFADEHPEFHVRPGPGLVAHPDRPWQRATVDALVAESPDGPPIAVFDAKTGSSRVVEWGEEGSDEVPLPYLCQLVWYMDVYGLDRGFVGVLLDGCDYREYTVEYDADLAARMRAHCAVFWHHHVLAGVAPEADGLDDTTRVLSEVHDPQRGSKGELPVEVVGWAQIYRAAREDEKAAAARKEEAANHIRSAFVAAGSPHYGYVAGKKVASWSVAGGGPVDVFDEEAFAADHPDLYRKYLTTRMREPTRRLTVAKESA